MPPFLLFLGRDVSEMAWLQQSPLNMKGLPQEAAGEMRDLYSQEVKNRIYIHVYGVGTGGGLADLIA